MISRPLIEREVHVGERLRLDCPGPRIDHQDGALARLESDRETS